MTRLVEHDEKLKAPKQRAKKQKAHCRFDDFAFRLVMVTDAIAVDEQREILVRPQSRDRSQMDPGVTLFLIEPQQVGAFSGSSEVYI